MSKKLNEFSLFHSQWLQEFGIEKNVREEKNSHLFDVAQKFQNKHSFEYGNDVNDQVDGMFSSKIRML